MADEIPPFQELQELYARKTNIMGLLRERTGSRQNSVEAILIAYDLQAGSYVQALQDPTHHAAFEAYTGEIAGVLRTLGGGPLLEAGVGEATTLCAVAAQLPECQAAGFDISWSRVAYGRRHAETLSVHAHLFTGDLFHIPVSDSAAGIVYTAHSIEPNHGREREALAELARVSRRWIALFEPSYELGNAETRARIEAHGYCRGLPEAAAALGLRVVRHELLQSPINPKNQTALLLLEKPDHTAPVAPSFFACPSCRTPLQSSFCSACSLIYPVIGGIPCLLPGNGVLGSKYLEFSTP